MRGKLMDLLLNGFGPLNASEEILTKLCLPLHFPSPLLYFMCLSLSLIPLSPPPLLFPHPLSLSLSFPLAGRCWQQFSPSGPIWQPGQGPGSHQEWHRHKYSQSGERARTFPVIELVEVIASGWRGPHLTASQ